MRRIGLLLTVVAIAYTGQLAAQHKGQAPPPVGLVKHTIRSLSLSADSAALKWEFGTDLNVAQSGDSLLGDVRVGHTLGSSFSFEVLFGARATSPKLEGQVGLNVTGAILPGSTVWHGEAVQAQIAYHRNPDGNFQWCGAVGTLNRAVISAAGLAARPGVLYQHCFAQAAGNVPSSNNVIAQIAISFWR